MQQVAGAGPDASKARSAKTKTKAVSTLTSTNTGVIPSPDPPDRHLPPDPAAEGEGLEMDVEVEAGMTNNIAAPALTPVTDANGDANVLSPSPEPTSPIDLNNVVPGGGTRNKPEVTLSRHHAQASGAKSAPVPAATKTTGTAATVVTLGTALSDKIAPLKDEGGGSSSRFVFPMTGDLLLLLLLKKRHYIVK
jgi:hypothetical protein